MSRPFFVAHPQGVYINICAKVGNKQIKQARTVLKSNLYNVTNKYTCVW